VAIALVAIALIALGAVATLPLTDHAQTKHQDEKVNATSLVALVTAGTCRDMQVYDCPDDATIKILCKVGNNVVGGLVIGTKFDGSHHIITGYGGRPAYWQNNVNNCRYIGGLFAVQ